MTIVMDGTVVRSYNPPYLQRGHVMAPIDPFVTSVAASVSYSAGMLVIIRGDRFAQVPMALGPHPAHYDSTYVEIAPVLRTLGASVFYDAASHRLIVRTPRVLVVSPSPFNGAVPQPTPTAVFTPTPAITSRPIVTGAPVPRRTPLPVAAPTPSPR